MLLPTVHNIIWFNDCYYSDWTKMYLLLKLLFANIILKILELIFCVTITFMYQLGNIRNIKFKWTINSKLVAVAGGNGDRFGNKRLMMTMQFVILNMVWSLLMGYKGLIKWLLCRRGNTERVERSTHQLELVWSAGCTQSPHRCQVSW